MAVGQTLSLNAMSCMLRLWTTLRVLKKSTGTCLLPMLAEPNGHTFAGCEQHRMMIASNLRNFGHQKSAGVDN